MKAVYALLLVCLFLAPWTSRAESVSRITIKSTTGRPISRELVEGNMRLRAGGPFTAEQLSDDIKTLTATKQFDDVKCELFRTAAEQVEIVLLVTPKPRVAAIKIDGNVKLSTKKLTKKLTQEEGGLLNQQLLKDDLEALLKYYHEKNYHDVEIKQEIVKLPETGDVNIFYHISENARAKTRGIIFEGNTAISTSDLRDVMQTDISIWGYFLPAGFFKSDVFKRDLDELRMAYLNKGYLDCVITCGAEDQQLRNNKMYLTIHISEGQPYTTAKITVMGMQKLSEADVRALLVLKEGQAYGRKLMENSADAVTDKYNDMGYLDAVINSAIEPVAASHTVTVTFSIDEGTQSHIRDVNISGNRITKDQVIRREMTILPGDPSNGTKLKTSKNRLNGLNYFKDVDVLAVSTPRDDEKDVNVKVVEKETGTLSAGLGASSADSVFLTGEIGQTNFDLSNWPTFRGGGQRLRLSATVGLKSQSYSLNFTEPWLFNRPLRLDYSLWYTSTTSNRSWSERSVGTSATLTHKLWWPNWRESFGYRIEDVTISDIDSSFSPRFRDYEDGSHVVSAVTYGIFRDTRDSQMFANSGSNVRLSTELQGEAIGSYTNLYKLRLNADKYVPVFKSSVVKFSGSIGQEQSFGGDRPRVFDRFFAGGLDSVRGFKERSLGPVDPDNFDAVGGESIMLASTEILTPFYKKFVYGVFFIDAGNTWERAFGYQPENMNVGVGPGLVLALPIGTVNLAVGFPVLRQGDNNNQMLRFHFSLGYTF